jgi:Protein of unknown function (DUF1475)
MNPFPLPRNRGRGRGEGAWGKVFLHRLGELRIGGEGMRTFLIGLFTVLLISLAALIIAASLERGVLEAGRGLWPDPWFRATLADAYIGFVIFYVWVAYKERSARSRIVWFALIMGLGNMAAAFYVLLQLGKLQPGDGWEKLLLWKAS